MASVSRPDPVDSPFKGPLSILRDPISSLKFFTKFGGSSKSSNKGEAFALDVHLSDALDSVVRSLKALDQDRKKFGGILSNLRFARIGAPPSEKNLTSNGVESVNSGLTFSTASVVGLFELMPQPLDGNQKFSVQDFMQYAETDGRLFFEEMDRDKDGRIRLEDLENALSKRKLPKWYARELLCCARRHCFSKSIGWKQFLSLMKQKDLAALQAYSTICSSKPGTLQKDQIAASLQIAGVSHNEDTVAALMNYLNADSDKHISYSQFRNFMILLPSEQYQGNSRKRGHEAASVFPASTPSETVVQSVLKSALAGGIACSFSAFVMHPVDTVKTCVQASTLSLPELVSKLPKIGLRGLYRGSIPTVLGQFSSHGMRTGFCEASKFLLMKAVPGLPEIQVQTLASFCSTILGTTSRVPCEVLKQRLQAGIFENVGEAAIVTFREDGIRGFFRGTGATLCREVPFYVAGMGLYEEAKKAVQKLLRRDLEPWETVVVGAVTGGLASVLTTPFDVIKTRMMIAPHGVQLSMQAVALTIVREEGPLTLFRGALPRFFWVAPLGAMNFAGYELIRKAMDRAQLFRANQQHTEEEK